MLLTYDVCYDDVHDWRLLHQNVPSARSSTFEANAAPMWWQVLSQIQWLLMPVADLFFGSMAGLDAQLHMAIQPTMKYEVSTKVSKDGKVGGLVPDSTESGASDYQSAEP